VGVTGSGAAYGISLSGSPSNGTVSFSIGAGKAQDAAANLNTASTSTDNTVTYDTLAPSVTVEQKAGQADPASVLPIVWTVTFAESVTGFDGSDLMRGGTSTGGTVSVTGSGASYEISLSGTPTGGTISFAIASNRAQDLAGNGNTSSTSVDNTVSYNKPPTVTITSCTTGSGHRNTVVGTTDVNTGSVSVKIFNGAGIGGTLATTLTATPSAGAWSATTGNQQLTAGATYTAQATQTDAFGGVSNEPTCTFTAN
jgi:hypothetical protein